MPGSKSFTCVCQDWEPADAPRPKKRQRRGPARRSPDSDAVQRGSGSPSADRLGGLLPSAGPALYGRSCSSLSPEQAARPQTQCPELMLTTWPLLCAADSAAQQTPATSPSRGQAQRVTNAAPISPETAERTYGQVCAEIGPYRNSRLGKWAVPCKYTMLACRVAATAAGTRCWNTLLAQTLNELWC